MLRIISAGILLTLFSSTFAQYDIKDEDVKAQEIIHEKPAEWSVYASDEPVSIFVINNDVMWYATATSVFKASIAKRTVQQFPKLGTMDVSDIACMTVNGNNVWIGGKNGVAKQNRNKFTVFTAENGLPDNSVNALYSFNGKVWVGTDKGLACYNRGKWNIFTSSDGLSHNKVTAFTSDNSGNLWVGTQKGISVFNGNTWTVYDMKKGLSWNNVKALGFDPRKKAIWAAVGEKDVNTFKNGEWNTFMDVQEDITSIMIDSQSRVWIGSPNGLIKYNGDEWINDPKQLFVPASQVQWMYKDAVGNLYYACENGIIRLSNPYPF